MLEKQTGKFYILLTPCILLWSLVNDQLDAQFLSMYLFISVLYMFRATSCSSSGESIVSIQPLVYVTLCRWPFLVSESSFPTCKRNGHRHKVTYTYTRGCIDTIDSPDDEHKVARNM